MIAGFRLEVDGNCALLVYYAASMVIPYWRFGTICPSHLQGQESRKKARFLLGFLTLKLEKIGCSETMVRNYH